MQQTTDATQTPPAESNGSRRSDAAAERRPFHRRPAFLIFIVVILLLAVGGAAYFLYSRQFEETDDAFIDGHIIPINPQVPAVVASVRVDDNALVHKGDLLVELDPTDYQVAVAQARGAEAAARGKLEQAKSAVPSARSAIIEAQAELDAAKVSFENTSRDLKRYLSLDERAKSQQQVDNATAAQKRAQADVEQAQAKLEAARSQVTTAEASVTAAQGDVQKAQADTRRAEVNLGYCRIVAPCDGKITNKTVDAGMYVTTSTQLFQIVPPEVWVTANFKETQLNHMRVGQDVSLTVDAYPGREFSAKVNSVQSGTGSRFSVIPAENATGNFVKVVQRVPVKITFEGDVNNDPARPLAPGMSIEAKVRVKDRMF